MTELTHSTPAASPRIAARLRVAAAAAVGLVVALFAAVSTFSAVVLPYSRWDALYFGAWSRLIAAGSFHGPGVDAAQLQRPLFYVAQGLLWKAFGFHELLGRLLSLAFSLLLAASVYALGRRLRRTRLEALLGVLALALVPSFALDVAGGTTDIPAAALVAATAAALWLRPPGRGRVALVGLLACAATLAKPSALFALAGLGLAEALGPRPGLRRRLALGVAPIAAGAVAALAYDAVEAHGQHTSLPSFLAAGTSGYYTRLSASMRADVLLRGDWLGPDLRLLLAFGLLYALLRAAGAAARVSAAAAAAAAAVATWFLPSLASGGPAFGAGPFGGGLGWHGAVYLLTLALVFLSMLAGEEDALGRLWSARLLVWALPAVVAWVAKATYADRLVSPAWPPLLLLATTPVVLALRAASRRRAGLAPAVLLPLMLAGVLALPTVEGLGARRWRALGDANLAGWRDGERMANFAYGTFDDELTAVRAYLAPGQRLISSDGRLRFFYPRSLSYRVPERCAALSGQRAFVLLLDPDSIAQNGNTDVDGWLSCRAPPTHLVADIPGSFAVFLVGAPPRMPPAPDACRVLPPPGIVAVLGDGLDRAAAYALRRRAISVGFRNARVELRGCTYDVVVPGYTSMSEEAGVQAEAASVGLHVHFEDRK